MIPRPQKIKCTLLKNMRALLRRMSQGALPLASPTCLHLLSWNPYVPKNLFLKVYTRYGTTPEHNEEAAPDRKNHAIASAPIYTPKHHA